MNMPSARGELVHQMIVDHNSTSMEQFCSTMNRDEFIICRQWYKRKDPYTKEVSWEDRGNVILNTHHIGKVLEYIEFDNQENHDDESQGRTQFSRQYTAGPRGPIRPGRFGV
jgi:hypothetical protein